MADGGVDDQGTQAAGVSKTVTYTITNTGLNSSLTLGAPASANLTNVVVNSITVPSASVAPGASTTFQVTYTPVTAGPFSFDISFSNNDSDENPYDITLSGDALEVNVAVETSATESSTSGAFRITQSGLSATDTVVTYSISGTATNPDDFTAPVSGMATIPAGSTTVDIPVTVVDDALVEGDETITITLDSVSSGFASVGATDTATVTITDNDAAALTIADVTAAENGTFTVTVTLNNAVAGGFTVPVSTADGSATAGSDYTAIAAQVLTFAGTAGETQTFTITVNDDAILEGDEDLTVSMGAASVANVTTTDTATVTITDNDGAALTIADVTEAENGTFTVTVTLDNAVAGGFTVPVSTADGSATAGSDYTAIAAQVLTFAGTAGETQTFTITVNDDAVLEGNEDLTVSMGAASVATVATTDTATITITDNEAGIEISGAGIVITDGDATPGTTDHTDFGTAIIGSTTVTRHFTITNTGYGNLNLGTLTLGGAGAGDFSITSPPSASLAPGASTTFSILFAPSAAGISNAEISIATNVAGSDPYNFAIAGTGQANGSVTIVLNLAGPDRSVSFTSATPALTFVLASSGGTGMHVADGLSAGTYSVTAQDLSAAGYGLASIACGDSDSVGDTSTGTATITLAAQENVTCTFNMVESRDHTSKVVADYLGARNRILLAHQPDIKRRFDRLNDRFDGSDLGSASVNAFGMNLSAPLPWNINITENELAFSGSLFSYFGSGKGSDDMATAYVTRSRWDVWAEGKIARYKHGGEEANFGVLYGGIDYRIDPNVLVGLMIQYDWLNQSTSGSNGTGSSVSGFGWMVGPYGLVRISEDLYFDARAAWGRSSNQIKPFNTYEDEFDTERWLVSAALIGEHNIGNWTIRPAVRFQYIEENQQSYKDSFGVRIPKQTVSQGDLRIGPRIGYNHQMQDGSLLTPWIEFEGVYNFTEEGRFSDGSYADQINGWNGSVKAGFEYSNVNGVSLMLNGQLDGLGSGAVSYGAGLKLTVPIH